MKPPERLIQALLFLAVIAVFVLFQPIHRQVHADDWLPIAPDDLALKDNPASPGSDAMVLYRDSAVDASNAIQGGDQDEEYVRIKIFTQAGVQKGDVEIEFFKSENDVKDVRGRTIHPDGSIVDFSGKVLEKEVVKSSGIRILAKTFSLPDVQPGSIIEYKYRIQGNPHYLHSEQWLVSSEFFTREAHFSYVPYAGSYSSFLPLMRSAGLPAEASPQCSISGKCTMVAHNIPAVVDEPLMPPPHVLEARVEFYYQPINEAHGETPEAYWSRISKKLNGELEHFIDVKSALSSEVARIVAPADTPDVKLRKIYARTQKIRNLNLEESRTPQEQKEEEIKRINDAGDVLTNGYGTGRNINQTFVGLARAAGFDAAEVFIATRNDHLFVPQAADARDLNADLVWVSAGGKEYYLDPGAKYYPFGVLPWYETNDGGLRLGKKGGEQIMTPTPLSSEAKILRSGDFSMSAMGELTGTLRIEFVGREGALRREEDRNDDELGRKKAIEDDIKGWIPFVASLENTTISNWDDVEQPLHVETTLTIAAVASSAGSRILMPAEIFRGQQSAAFQAQKRVNMVYFQYPYEESDDLKIRAPIPYKISSLPASPKIDRGLVTYSLSASQDANVAEIKRDLIVNAMLLGKDAYPALRAFFFAVKSADDSQIVLQNGQNAQN